MSRLFNTSTPLLNNRGLISELIDKPIHHNTQNVISAGRKHVGRLSKLYGHLTNIHKAGAIDKNMADILVQDVPEFKQLIDEVSYTSMPTRTGWKRTTNALFNYIGNTMFEGVHEIGDHLTTTPPEGKDALFIQMLDNVHSYGLDVTLEESLSLADLNKSNALTAIRKTMTMIGYEAAMDVGEFDEVVKSLTSDAAIAYITASYKRTRELHNLFKVKPQVTGMDALGLQIGNISNMLVHLNVYRLPLQWDRFLKIDEK